MAQEDHGRIKQLIDVYKDRDPFETPSGMLFSHIMVSTGLESNLCTRAYDASSWLYCQIDKDSLYVSTVYNRGEVDLEIPVFYLNSEEDMLYYDGRYYSLEESDVVRRLEADLMTRLEHWG